MSFAPDFVIENFNSKNSGTNLEDIQGTRF